MNVLQLVVNKYLAQKLPPEPGQYNMNILQLMTYKHVDQKLPPKHGGYDMNLTQRMSIKVMMKNTKQRRLLTDVQWLLSQTSFKILQFVIPFSSLYRCLLLCSAWFCFILEGSKVMKAWEGDMVLTCMYHTYVDI